jgi:hypothetical protein
MSKQVDKIYYTPDKFIERYNGDDRTYRQVLKDEGIDSKVPIKIYYYGNEQASYMRNLSKEEYDNYWKKYYILKAIKELE